jgi:cytochrome c peroxidase
MLMPHPTATSLALACACLAGCSTDSGNSSSAQAIDRTAASAIQVTPVANPEAAVVQTPSAALGDRLFNDPNLSQPAGTSCASCHNPKRAWTGNNGGTFGVPLGSLGIAGLRNTPTVMYASFTPAFSVNVTNGQPGASGGFFHDGRVDTAAAQALIPLLTMVEMNNANASAVVAKVAASSYANQFKAQWGAAIFSDPNAALAAIGQSIAAYEATSEFHPFTSRYDDLVRGQDHFTAAEHRGMRAFFDRAKGDCASCHTANPTSADPAASLFTNRSYVALGVPRNPAIPANADPTFFDLGLAGPKRSAPPGLPQAAGQFKVPTLRNVALKPAFMHNGRFKTLTEVVSFYATRDIDPNRWYPLGQKFNDLPATLRTNVTHRPPLDLHPGAAPRLTPGDVSDIVAFLGTLTDPPALGALSVAQ